MRPQGPEPHVTLASGLAIGLLLAILAFALFASGTAYFDPTAFDLTTCGDRTTALAYFAACGLACGIALVVAGVQLRFGNGGRALTALLPALALAGGLIVVAPHPVAVALAPAAPPSYCSR